MNTSCVHAPIPVSESGVRFAAQLTPHGPENAVIVMSPAHIHGISTLAGASIFITDGCPESILFMSGPGPCGPITHGVWQSLQPPTVTRYFPRSAEAGVAVAWAPFFGAHVMSATLVTAARPAVTHILKTSCFFMEIKLNVDFKTIPLGQANTSERQIYQIPILLPRIRVGRLAPILFCIQNS